jgi:methyl-accepting chemotaxis protein
MFRNWTFGGKVAIGFTATLLLALAIGGVGIYGLRAVVSAKDHVIDVNAQRLVDAESLRASAEAKAGAARGFLLSRDDQFIARMREARTKFSETLSRVKQDAESPDLRRLADEIERAEADHQRAMDEVIARRRTDAPVESIVRAFEEQVIPKRDQLDTSLRSLVSREERQLQDNKQAATDAASTATTLVTVIAVVSTLVSAVIAYFLTRLLSQQIGGAVQHVQSSSAELQAAANQQAVGSKEQSTAMNEISTTISELLVTTRQIAESAQRVTQIAEQTATSARSGDGTVAKARESISGIRRQVDLVVNHMLELGSKSQQIGAVLEIVSELAEQTNILAINATIEAAGAGEAGQRFAVVADEIRKLADRVAASTKEIRTLIDDVRSAVNTTVMSTETGSKAVDTGSSQFDEVAAAFRQIAELVTTTSEAAREIGLSTKQQATAVEQVNVAITNVAQTTRETEASSSQTLQTASQLTVLSKDLLRLVQSQTAA